jgi:hypothetical protein
MWRNLHGNFDGTFAAEGKVFVHAGNVFPIAQHDHFFPVGPCETLLAAGELYLAQVAVGSCHLLAAVTCVLPTKFGRGLPRVNGPWIS